MNDNLAAAKQHADWTLQFLLDAMAQMKPGSIESQRLSVIARAARSVCRQASEAVAEEGKAYADRDAK